MGVDLVTWALDQLGVAVTPWIAWVILLVGGALILCAGVGGGFTIVKTIKSRRQLAHPAPFKWWFDVTQMTRQNSVDALLGSGEEGDFHLYCDARFEISEPCRIDPVVHGTIMGESIQGTLVGETLLETSTNRLIGFHLPKKVCMDSPKFSASVIAGSQHVPSQNKGRLHFNEYQD